jgi:hypothetical protein
MKLKIQERKDNKQSIELTITKSVSVKTSKGFKPLHKVTITTGTFDTLSQTDKRKVLVSMSKDDLKRFEDFRPWWANDSVKAQETLSIIETILNK